MSFRTFVSGLMRREVTQRADQRDKSGNDRKNSPNTNSADRRLTTPRARSGRREPTGKVLGAITISVDGTESPAVTWCAGT